MSGAEVRVSVCIATYNQEAYIERCVESVLAQQGDFALEVWVGDDGSVDATPAILEGLAARHPGRLRVLRRSPNMGGTENYQDLIGRCTGDYIAHLDGDDEWLPGKLQAQVAVLEAERDCAAAYTNAIVADSAGKALGRFTQSHPRRFDLAYLARSGNFLMHSAMVYRARHRHEILALQAPTTDYLMHIRLALQGPLAFIDEPLALYRQGVETSMLKNSYARVQSLLWQALQVAAARLGDADRRFAVSHFLAGTLLDRFCGKTASLDLRLAEASIAADTSPLRLLASAALHAVAIVLGSLRLRAGYVAGRPRVVHPRL